MATTYASQYVRWRWTDGTDTSEWSSLYQSEPAALPITSANIIDNGGKAYYTGDAWKVDFRLTIVDTDNVSATVDLASDDTFTLLLLDDRGAVAITKDETGDVTVNHTDDYITVAFTDNDTPAPGVYRVQISYEGTVVATGIFEVCRKYTE